MIAATLLQAVLLVGLTVMACEAVLAALGVTRD